MRRASEWYTWPGTGRRKQEVGRLALGKYNHSEIARLVSAIINSPVNRHTVKKDIEEWEQIWHAELVENPRKHKSEELARLDDMEQEAVTQYLTTRRASWWDRRMRVIAQRIALLGLAAPTEVKMDLEVHDDTDPKQELYDRVSAIASRSGADGGSSVPLN